MCPTHGSLTKAGKIRDQSQPIKWREGKKSKKGMPFHGKKKENPRVKNRRKYKIATMCPACSGTTKHGVVRTPIEIGVRKCWKCGARFEWKGLRPIVKRKKGGLPRRFR